MYTSIFHRISTLCFSTLCLTFSLSKPLQASNYQPYRGVSAFPAFAWPKNICDNFISAHRSIENKVGTAFLWKYFNNQPTSNGSQNLYDDGRCAERIVNSFSNRDNFIEIHPYFERERKIRREELRNKISEILKWITAVDRNGTPTGKRIWGISLGLEDVIKRNDIADLFYQETVQAIKNNQLANVIVIRNKKNTFDVSNFTRDNNFQSLYYELHPNNSADRRILNWNSLNTYPKKCIANMDGLSVNIFDSRSDTRIAVSEDKYGKSIDIAETREFVKENKDCFSVFLWYSPSQGFNTSGSNFDTNVNLSQREYLLTRNAAQSLVKIFNDVPYSTKQVTAKYIQNNYPQKLVSWNSKKCLDLSYGQTANGTPAQQYSCSRKNINQKFTFHEIAGGYQIRSVRANNLCLDVSGTSQADTAPVHFWECLGEEQKNQIWDLVPMAEGFQIRARHSGKCLDVRNVSHENFEIMQQYSCLGANQKNQIFRILPPKT